MKADDNIPIPARVPGATKYDFSDAKVGVSYWVPSDTKRILLMRAFRAWVAKEGLPFECITRRVGETDPNGSGYRLWVLGPAKSAQPLPAFPLTSFADLFAQTNRDGHSLPLRGIKDQADMDKAWASIEFPLDSRAAVLRGEVLILRGETPFQQAAGIKPAWTADDFAGVEDDE